MQGRRGTDGKNKCISTSTFFFIFYLSKHCLLCTELFNFYKNASTQTSPKLSLANLIRVFLKTLKVMLLLNSCFKTFNIRILMRSSPHNNTSIIKLPPKGQRCVIYISWCVTYLLWCFIYLPRCVTGVKV